MSSNYSANQYDSAFRSWRLQNWCETKRFKQQGSAWPDFKGTWDLPARIPARSINPTSRSVEGLNRLKCWGFDLQHTGTSQSHSKNKDLLKNAGEQTNGGQGAPLSFKQRHRDAQQDQ